MDVRTDQGMTLVEVLLALVILLVTTVVVVQALSVVLRLEGHSRIMNEAVPHLATLTHDRLSGLDGGEPSLDVPGWILEPRNEDEEDREQLYDLYPETRPTFRIGLVF